MKVKAQWIEAIKNGVILRAMFWMDELQGVESDRLSCPYLFWSFLAAELVLSLRRKGEMLDSPFVGSLTGCHGLRFLQAP